MPIDPQTATPEPKRYAALDTWRFIAALGVVAYHYENHLSPLATHPSQIFEAFGHFVDFFFVLSGFVLMHTYGARVSSLAAYRDFMQKRLARVYPFHALITLIFGAVAIYVAIAGIRLRDPATMSPSLILPHMLLIHAWGPFPQPGLNFPSWSISAELFVYLLFPLFAWITVRFRAFATLGLALAFAAVLEFVRLRSGMRTFAEATWDYGILRAVPTFLAGMAMQQIVVNLPRVRLSWIWAHGLMIAILGLLYMQASIYIILVAFVAAVGVIAATERGGATSMLQNPFCVRLGDASYGVYLLHTMVQVATLVLVRKLGLSDWPSLIAIAAAGTLVIILMAMASFTWFETPARRFLSRPFSEWFAPALPQQPAKQ